MSSTERAPEPTMEEILASIRRIISEDESSAARQHTAPQNQADEEVLESGEGEADDEIINDIARVLSGSGSAAQPAPEAAAVAEEQEQEEDILDLTAELGGLELVEEVEELELVEVVEEEAPAEMYQAAPARSRPTLTPVDASFEAEAELELVEEASPEVLEAEASAPEPVVEQPAPMAQPAPAAARPMSASEEAASALERAIAALRAGQVPTSSTAFSFQPSPEPVFSQPEPFFQAQPEAPFQPQSEPEALAEPAPSIAAPAFEPVSIPEPVSAPEAETEAEPELVLTEVEIEMIEAEPVLIVETLVSEPQLDRGWGMSAASDWSVGREGEAEEETETPHVNGGGGSYADSAAKSLEDSVKDMLRPMLRQWLDENMARVLTAALKDELKNNPARPMGD